MIRIIIPAYNEGKNLAAVVQGIARVLQDQSYEIIIVNDGSADDTRNVAEALAASFPVTVLNHSVNRGVAEAFRTGITQAASSAESSDEVVIMEGDGTSPPELLPTLAARIGAGADVVIASRYQPGGKYLKFPFKRLVLSRGANLLFRWFFPVPGVRDYSIFYRAYRAEVLQRALAHYGERFITVQTFFANIEILLHVVPFAQHMEEVPLVYDYGKKQGKSGMRIVKNLRSYLLFLFLHAFRSSDK
jgi:dolichol-phosphate mannosyltransferase